MTRQRSPVLTDFCNIKQFGHVFERLAAPCVPVHRQQGAGVQVAPLESRHVLLRGPHAGVNLLTRLVVRVCSSDQCHCCYSTHTPRVQERAWSTTAGPSHRDDLRGGLYRNAILFRYSDTPDGVRPGIVLVQRDHGPVSPPNCTTQPLAGVGLGITQPRCGSTKQVRSCSPTASLLKFTTCISLPQRNWVFRRLSSLSGCSRPLSGEGSVPSGAIT